MKTSRYLVVGLLALLPGGAVQEPCAAPDRERPAVPGDTRHLVFGVYQTDKATVVYRKFIPVIEALAARMEPLLDAKVDVELRITKTYDEGIDALVSGTVDFARFGPAPYITARSRNGGIEPVAMEIENGSKRFKGLIVVPAKSPVSTIAELRGRSFAFGDPHSTIGRYLVQALLVDQGIHAKDLARFAYLDRHDKVAKAVEIGDFDAGSVKTETYKAFPAGVLRVLAEFDNVTKPWVTRAGIDPRVRDAIRQALLALDDKQALEELGVTGFAPTSDEEYRCIREGMAKAAAFEAR